MCTQMHTKEEKEKKKDNMQKRILKYMHYLKLYEYSQVESLCIQKGHSVTYSNSELKNVAWQEMQNVPFKSRSMYM